MSHVPLPRVTPWYSHGQRLQLVHWMLYFLPEHGNSFGEESVLKSIAGRLSYSVHHILHVDRLVAGVDHRTNVIAHLLA